ncbi:MAG: alkaline phosphatase family protein [Candidatus Eremiobacteraeota bacterium]|nr:alkaline phosphatase family protein [Candidatus Eremiobacteraeota bacterium]
MATAVLLMTIAASLWYFRSSHTRLTPVATHATRSLERAIGSQRLPKTPRSVVVIVEENKSYRQIVDDPDAAPYLNALARRGALFTHSYGVAHPSQPNYIAMFAGVTNSNGDGCPPRAVSRIAPNLAVEMRDAHRTFRGYAEDLPTTGFRGCSSGRYASKHAPWTFFTNVPREDGVALSTLRSYETLPDLAFVIPNLVHDMHSAGIERGDAWLHEHIDPLITWANGHNTLVVVTWDESSAKFSNHIPTLFVGPMVRPGRYDEPVTHFRLLRTIEDLFGLPHAGRSADVEPILDCWT